MGVRNVVLIGFMGSGKSSVGRKLAGELGLRFVDTDSLIEERTHERIEKIFRDQGEEVFRALEAQTVAEVSGQTGQVIACGGGAVLSPRNVEALKRKGFLVYLKASIPVIYERVKESMERPLLNVSEPKAEIERLLALRERIYERVSDLIVDTTDRSIEEIVDEIKRRLKEMKWESE